MTPTSPVTLNREVERLIELRRKVAALPEPTYPILAVRIVDVDDLIADAIQAARAVIETPEGLDVRWDDIENACPDCGGNRWVVEGTDYIDATQVPCPNPLHSAIADERARLAHKEEHG